MDICLDCLQKQKPWVSKDMIILSAQQGQCNECNENKQLVCVYTESDKKILKYDDVFGICLNQLYGVIHVDTERYYMGSLSHHLDELEITLRTLVVNLGWDRVRDRYMYIEGQEEGKPLAFKTYEEYEPYLDYRVIELENFKTIIREQTTDE